MFLQEFEFTVIPYLFGSSYTSDFLPLSSPMVHSIMEKFLPAYYYSTLFRHMDGLLTAFRTFRNCAVHQKSLKLFVDTLPATNRATEWITSTIRLRWVPFDVHFSCNISFCMLLFFPDARHGSRRDCCLFAQ